MGKFPRDRFLMQEMYRKDWRSTTLVLRKPSGEEQVEFLIWNNERLEEYS
jgi:hypothetical protein